MTGGGGPLTAVIATAGHVDHGKSALVRALTGIEPDRWSEERERGLTIDLGYAWTTLGTGETVSFVDVPGHQRFIGNMLAGVGPAAAVMLVVAADEGWRQQTTEHLLAIDALGIRHGLLVVTRSDLADPGPAMASAKERIARSSLGQVEAVAASARTGAGVDELRAALSRLVTELPVPRRDGRTRVWIDRTFTIRGAGTVVTGTLGEGRLTVGEAVRLIRPGRTSYDARVRGLQSLDSPIDHLAATARAAVNLPSVDVGDVGRGDLLLAGQWPLSDTLDVRLTSASANELPEELMLHVGSHAAQVRVRPLGDDAVRLRLPATLPLVAGDRAILRNPGLQHVVTGIEVLDVDPPPLRRRGAAAQRGVQLASYDESAGRLRDEVTRRGAAEIRELESLGYSVDEVDSDIQQRNGWLISPAQWQSWVDTFRMLTQQQHSRDPLEPSLAEDAVVRSLGLPRREWLSELAPDAGAELVNGRVQVAGAAPSLGPADAALDAIEQRLAAKPWAAPEQHELDAAGLGNRELAAAVRLGRILRLPGDIVLLPSAPALAMRELAALPQPFTTSQARQALDTTRRVAIPLLEHLDSRGWTRRLDGSTREVVRRTAAG
ncbi:selenocysteine-specific translation elongation factor [Blastococcus sp. Marseille-P5729]|uniref:selenocysteine-specific translation elongation factor n=1 Tax=Blastococcus sp. Marseille-P5729 TaxID=2086582 RepID=UPI000D106B26|nr:selenocysteine-specific translation elongation factor [Blastococcus sp. Marseille-P5729]